MCSAWKRLKRDRVDVAATRNFTHLAHSESNINQIFVIKISSRFQYTFNFQLLKTFQLHSIFIFELRAIQTNLIVSYKSAPEWMLKAKTVLLISLICGWFSMPFSRCHSVRRFFRGKIHYEIWLREAEETRTILMHNFKNSF